MNKINLLPFFDLDAGTWDKQKLFLEVRWFCDEEKTTNIINRLDQYMTPELLSSPGCKDIDNVLHRLRTNRFDAYLVVGEDMFATHLEGYDFFWVADIFSIGFNNRSPADIEAAKLKKLPLKDEPPKV